MVYDTYNYSSHWGNKPNLTGGPTLRLWTFDQPPMTAVYRDFKSSGRCWKCFGKGWYTLAYSGPTESGE